MNTLLTYIECPECIGYNDSKKTCPLCNSVKTVTISRIIQWNLGFVCWLEEGIEAPTYIMNDRCQSIVNDICKKYNTPNPNIPDSNNGNGSEVMYYFIKHPLLKCPDFYLRPTF